MRNAEALADFREESARVLRDLSPPLAVATDPPVRREALRISAPGEVSEAEELLRLPRVTPSGLTSSLCVSARSWVADSRVDYCLLFIRTIAGGGRTVRTHGTAIRRDEARDVARALLEWVDALDAKDGAP
jgi:hypothetical protein